MPASAAISSEKQLFPRPPSPRSNSNPESQRMADVPDHIFFATITEINQKLKAREFSAVELTRAFSDRLEKLGPRYNALALSLRPSALRQARDIDGDIKRERFRGPLQGIPFGAK